MYLRQCAIGRHMNSYQMDLLCQQSNAILFHRDGILCQIHSFATGVGNAAELGQLITRKPSTELPAAAKNWSGVYWSGVYSNIRVLCSPAHLACNKGRCFDFVFDDEISFPDSIVMYHSVSF